MLTCKLSLVNSQKGDIACRTKPVAEDMPAYSFWPFLSIVLFPDWPGPTDFTVASDPSKYLCRHIRGLSQQNQCYLCKKSFASRSNLDAHITGVHYKAKMYKCVQCGMSFTYKNNVYRHRKLCKGPSASPTSNLWLCTYFQIWSMLFIVVGLGDLIGLELLASRFSKRRDFFFFFGRVCRSCLLRFMFYCSTLPCPLPTIFLVIDWVNE